jgi:presenilin-like A22 family membrane protease
MCDIFFLINVGQVSTVDNLPDWYWIYFQNSNVTTPRVYMAIMEGGLVGFRVLFDMMSRSIPDMPHVNFLMGIGML